MGGGSLSWTGIVPPNQSDAVSNMPKTTDANPPHPEDLSNRKRGRGTGERRVSRANRNLRKAGRSWVYFVQVGQDGPIKIGQSRDVGARIDALQNAHHEPITLLGTVPEVVVTERMFHDKFARFRIRGEWFRPVDEIKAVAAAGKAIYEGGWVSIIPEDVIDHLPTLLLCRPIRRAA